MKKLLKIISKQTGQRFLEIKAGKPFYLSTGKEIPRHCINMPDPDIFSDGLYVLGKYTCDGKHGCKIGKLPKSCINRGIVSPMQCGKYYANKIGYHVLTTQDVIAIVTAINKK